MKRRADLPWFTAAPRVALSVVVPSLVLASTNAPGEAAAQRWIQSADEVVPTPAPDASSRRDARAREIFVARCLDCHGARGFAPLRFDAPDAVLRHRRLMHALVEDRTMPPDDLRGPVRPLDGTSAIHAAAIAPHGALSPADRAALLEALATREAAQRVFQAIPQGLRPGDASGAVLGDADTRATVTVLASGSFEVPGAGAMRLRSFHAEVPADAPRRIRGIRLPRIDDPARSPLRFVALAPDPDRLWRVLDEDRTGAEAMGDVGRTPSGALGALSRTAPVFLLPKGYAFELPRGDLVLEATVEPIGRPATVRPGVELLPADDGDTRTIQALAARIAPLLVAPNERVSRVVSVDTGSNRELVGLVAKGGAFLRGFTVEVVEADGCRTVVARAADFRMSLAAPIVYPTPLALPPGSTIEVAFDLDNTVANPLQPSAPPQELRGGLPPDAEDASIVLLVTPTMPAEPPTKRR